MINEWINKNYFILKRNIKKIKNIKEWEDIYHEVLLDFINMDKEKTEALIKEGNASRYIMSMFKINSFSKTSPYQTTYNKLKIIYTDNLIHLIDLKDEYKQTYTFEEFEKNLDDIDIFFIYKYAYKEYLYNKIKTPSYSIRKLSEETLTSHQTLVLNFNKIKDEIKKIIIKNEKK